ncbi:cytochrome P450 [Myxococcus fulvus]|uniref:cytochrome P450 n=1 Tax=Myxococcus fulvus TaxID=33 RepID=UPI003B997D24
MSTRLNFLSREFMENPYPYLAVLRQQGPVVQVDPGGMWAITRYDEAQFVLKSPQRFSSEGMRRAFQPEWLGRTNPAVTSMVFMDPPQHGRLRTLVSRAFTPAAIAHLESLIRATARSLVSQLLERRKVDFVEAFSVPIPATLMGFLLGLDISHQASFKRWAHAVLCLGGVRAEDTEQMARSRHTIDEMKMYLEEVLDDRRRRPREDMLSDLLRARVDGASLTHEEVLGFLSLLLIGGLETTTHLLSHSVQVLCLHPELLPQLREQPSLIPSFIEETLRYEPNGSALLRICLQDTLVSDVKIPQGALVLVSLSSASRDEKYFPDGDRFILGRKGAPHLSFGHGPHFCLGAMLARMEGRIALEELVPHVGRLELRTERIDWSYSLNTRGPKSLPIEVFPV